MPTIQQAAEALIKKHKGLRAAARATGLDAGYLSRLRSGLKAEPGEEVLSILGLDRHVTYRKRISPQDSGPDRPEGRKDADRGPQGVSDLFTILP